MQVHILEYVYFRAVDTHTLNIFMILESSGICLTNLPVKYLKWHTVKIGF